MMEHTSNRTRHEACVSKNHRVETIDITGVSDVSVEEARSRALSTLRHGGAKVQAVDVVSEASRTAPGEGPSYRTNLRVRVQEPLPADPEPSVGLA